MNQKSRTRRKTTSSNQPEASASQRSPTSAAPSPGAEGEVAVLAREEAILIREQDAGQREAAIDLREEAVKRREDGTIQRDVALRAQEAIVSARLEQTVRVAARLQKAKDRLGVATADAQRKVEAAERATAQMSYMAEHDFLTGLPNRSLLADRLAQALALAQRHGKHVALMYLDLDRFKHINDSLGHAVGDQLLQLAAGRLQACVRLSDTVCRMGGDEFVVLLGEVDGMRDAALIAETLLDAIAEPHIINDHPLHVTMSVGISGYPDDAKDVDTLFRNADVAMYHAKRSGRNKYQLFTPDMNVRASARQSVEELLRHALEQHEFALHYQPTVNLETTAFTGAEALLRLEGADHRLVRPTEFMSVAEECGLIVPIGRWVLHEACRQTQAWLQAGLDVRRIAVNVSAQEFHAKDFVAGVRAILDDTGVDPRQLELELTESGLMHDTEQTSGLLHALKNLGVQIAVDDFGTGYSSLSYLRRFPVDTVKIDQLIVHDIGGADEGITVGAIIAMGKSLGKRLVAEGIETQQQLAFLQSHLCAEGQGHIFSQPMAAEEFAALLGTDRQRAESPRML